MIKNISNDENRFKRINVQKIASLKDLFNKPVLKLYLILNLLKKLIKFQIYKEEGSTEVKINLMKKKELALN